MNRRRIEFNSQRASRCAAYGFWFESLNQDSVKQRNKGLDGFESRLGSLCGYVVRGAQWEHRHILKKLAYHFTIEIWGEVKDNQEILRSS